MIYDELEKEFSRKLKEGINITNLKPLDAECGMLSFSQAIIAYLQDGSKMIYMPAEEGE